MHGNHPELGLRQQVRVLLAPPLQPRGHGVEVENGPGRGRPRGRPSESLQDDQTDER